MKAAKVLILGGAGVFGSRVAALLLRDGADVTIAGRNLKKAQAAARKLGCAAVHLDRCGDLATILSARPTLVVDAAGPFQSYGDEGYRLAHFCLSNAIHYFDLSDDAAFTRGIGALDALASEQGRVALSGASSVPAISAAAVRALSADMTVIEAIDSAIVPGNRAPRGKSVVAAILGQVGAPLKLHRGRWTEALAWSERRAYSIGNGETRFAYLIGAPDLALFPEAFGAKSVTFRAGLELGVLNTAVSFVAWCRRRFHLRPSNLFIEAALGISNLLARFGADRGGMIVSVTGCERRGPITRTWRLIAEAGEGPYVPAGPIRALVRKLNHLTPGARACLGDVSLAEIEAALSDVAVTTHTYAAPALPLFARALGDEWVRLPGAIRAAHEVWDENVFAGQACVTRGASMVARIAVVVFGFPKTADAVCVTVAMRRTPQGETWTRSFAGRAFRSHLSFEPETGFTERFGPFTFKIALNVKGDALEFPVAGGRIFGLPLPHWVLPVSLARESAAEGGFQFDVALHAPLGLGLIVQYRGWLAPVRD